MTVRLALILKTKETIRICTCTGNYCTSEGILLLPTDMKCNLLCARQSCEPWGWGEAGSRDKQRGWSCWGFSFYLERAKSLGPSVPTPALLGNPSFIKSRGSEIRLPGPCLGFLFTTWGLSWVLAPSFPVPSPGLSVAPICPGHDSISMATLELFQLLLQW